MSDEQYGGRQEIVTEVRTSPGGAEIRTIEDAASGEILERHIDEGDGFKPLAVVRHLNAASAAQNWTL